MFLTDFFNKIGHAFKSIFNSAQKAWNKVSPEIQKALLWGSGAVAIINKNVDAAPVFVLDLIEKKFPGLDREKLHNGMNQIAQALGVAQNINNTDILATIQALQVYLSGLKGKLWANISQTLAAGIAAAIAPPETKFAAISSLVEFVYQHYIKKQVETDEEIVVPEQTEENTDESDPQQ